MLGLGVCVVFAGVMPAGRQSCGVSLPPPCCFVVKGWRGILSWAICPLCRILDGFSFTKCFHSCNYFAYEILVPKRLREVRAKWGSEGRWRESGHGGGDASGNISCIENLISLPIIWRNAKSLVGARKIIVLNP